MSQRAFKTATQIASGIKSGEFSAVEILTEYFARVDRYNGDLNAIIVEQRDSALAAAKAADTAVANGDAQGP
ncbi:MAG: hypothetical protein ACR2PZ_27710, partial [Pseudomonadales bacterium]